MHVLIKGVFYIVGMSPDADSIKFKADNPDNWNNVTFDNHAKLQRELTEEAGVVTIRLQAIDALETHYTPPSVKAPSGLKSKLKGVEKPSKGNHKQNAQLGTQATDTFLDFMGATDITWKRWGRNTWIDTCTIHGRAVSEKFEDAIRGYVIINDVDRNGRPIGWVFVDEAPHADGTLLDKAIVGDLVPESANYMLVERGTVYPFFYMGLPAAIRIPLMEAAKSAQRNPDQDDVWTHDYTFGGVDLPSLDVLYDQTVLYPYLFRRLVRHWYTDTMQKFYIGIRDGDSSLPDGSDLALSLDHFLTQATRGCSLSAPKILFISARFYTSTAIILKWMCAPMTWFSCPSFCKAVTRILYGNQVMAGSGSVPTISRVANSRRLINTRIHPATYSVMAAAKQIIDTHAVLSATTNGTPIAITINAAPMT